jgi:hypothetical protein
MFFMSWLTAGTRFVILIAEPVFSCRGDHLTARTMELERRGYGFEAIGNKGRDASFFRGGNVLTATAPKGAILVYKKSY